VLVKKGNYWTGSITVPKDFTLSYKYFVIKNGFRVWEEGNNRTVICDKVNKNINDLWGHKKIKLFFKDICFKNDRYIIGNCEELGNMTTQIKLNKKN
jgi:hypothetical protein